MDQQKLILEHYLPQIKSVLETDNGNCEAIIDEMIDIVLRYRHIDAITSRGLPGQRLELLQQDPPDETGQNVSSDAHKDVRHGPGLLTKELPPYMASYVGKPCSVIVIATLHLEHGALSNIQDVVINVSGFEVPFAISGPYSNAIDRYMRTSEDRKAEKDFCVMTHPQARSYFARVISFVPAHKIDRYDMVGKTEVSTFDMHVDIEKRLYVGKVPKVNGKPIDIAVQQGKITYGFHLSELSAGGMRCSTVTKQMNIETTELKPSIDHKVNLYPYLVNKLNLDYVYVAGQLPHYSRKRPWGRPSSSAH